ncbi:YlaI family protein [Niallia sp. 03133]|uniref:YlaI family protein n=1 Tax=Niallia sp. 03133 TaxID=3458060 RepID=UPI004043BFE1
MKVKCVICDTIEDIDENSFQAKRLRNRPIHTYMCKKCDTRITENTQKRVDSGNFVLYRSKITEEEW